MNIIEDATKEMKIIKRVIDLCYAAADGEMEDLLKRDISVQSKFERMDDIKEAIDWAKNWYNYYESVIADEKAKADAEHPAAES